jgi:hypothetical protein
MTREDLKERLTDQNDEKLDKTLRNLETKNLVKLHHDARGTITLVKATYHGLRNARPLQEYKWYPDWLDKEHIF